MNRRGQAGVEFLIVTGIGLLLLVGVSFVLLSESKESRDRAQLQQAQAVAGELLAQARTVYALGANSWVTVDAVVPGAVSDMYTVEGNTLVMVVRTQYGDVKQPVFSEVPIIGAIASGSNYSLRNGTNFRTGSVTFRVSSNGTVVLLQQAAVG